MESPLTESAASRRRVLYVAHHHPHHQPGGAQGYAFELYQAMCESDKFEPLFLARTIDEVDDLSSAHLGTPLRLANHDANQYLFHAPTEEYDWFYMKSLNKGRLLTRFVQFLSDVQPDIVHFQHTQGFGYELLRMVRNALPYAPIVYTLHEFLPICHRHGQMLRTDDTLCTRASPQRCHECFPQYSVQDFFLRQRFVQSHLSVVDLFIAPSHFLLERYVQWGIPRERIRYVDNGRLPVNPLAEPSGDRVRGRLGFFGQINPFKGVDVLLKAMRILNGNPRRRLGEIFRPRRDPTPWDTFSGSTTRQPHAHLWIHGANLDIHDDEFQEEILELLSVTKRNVTFAGAYKPIELPKLMSNIDWVVVPSIWWENAPLVIQEAFNFGRPVICSNIGGMAEKVTHGVNGLHFRVGDAVSLAETIRYAVETPGLWSEFRKGIPEVHRMDDHVAELSDLYRTVLAQRVQAG